MLPAFQLTLSTTNAEYLRGTTTHHSELSEAAHWHALLEQNTGTCIQAAGQLRPKTHGANRYSSSPATLVLRTRLTCAHLRTASMRTNQRTLLAIAERAMKPPLSAEGLRGRVEASRPPPSAEKGE